MHNVKPRKPLLALLMSAILPGFGQLYNGEPNKAIWLFLGFAFLSIPGTALIALHVPNGWMMPALVSGLILTLGTWIYGMIDAWRSARQRAGHVPQVWQISGVYMLVLVLCNALALPLLIGYVRAHQVESFHIPSSSMAPSLLSGDIVFADKRYNCPGCKQGVRRGDIAIFANPNDRTQYYVKRIIGLPGDRVRIKGTDIEINGQALKKRETPVPGGMLATEQDLGREWQVFWSAGVPDTDTTVAPGQVFVLGDSRTASKDSRTFGTVTLQDVVGKVTQVWFSRSDEGVRWERLGKVLE